MCTHTFKYEYMHVIHSHTLLLMLASHPLLSSPPLHTHTHKHTHTHTHTHTHRIRNLFTYYISRGGAMVAIPIAATVYMGLLYLFVVATFFLASFVDPGIYPRGEW